MQEKHASGQVIASTTYAYDSLKRLQTETRSFNGLSGIFRVGYAYNYVDALTQVTYTVNSWQKSVNYGYYYSGALAQVGTDLIGGDATANVAGGYDYRAFPGMQAVNYGNGRKLALGYNQKRGQLTRLEVKKTDNSDPLMDLQYDYYEGGGGNGGNNGRIRRITNHRDGYYSVDYGYDDYNRLISAGPNHQRSYS